MVPTSGWKSDGKKEKDLISFASGFGTASCLKQG
jgi:hypothetical protein